MENNEVNNVEVKENENSLNNDPVSVIKKKKQNIFIDNLNVKIDVETLYNIETGEVISIFAKSSGIDIKESGMFAIEELSFEFSKISYEQLSLYRRSCSTYDPKTQQMVVDKIRVREFFIYYHLKDWNLKDENGEKIPLSFNPNGSIDSETAKIFFSLSPAYIDVILNDLETRLNLQ